MNNKLINEYSKVLKKSKKLLLIENDRLLLDELTNDILNNIYKNISKSLFIMELNFENSTKLSELKKNVKDFITNKSMFNQYPKLLLVKNLDISNKNILEIYSKVISMKYNILCLGTCCSYVNIPKSVIINSNIIWNKKEYNPITKKTFYEWFNNNKEVSNKDLLRFINLELFDYEEYKLILERFNDNVDNNVSLFKDECINLILKISC